jgi:TRAP-type C4-dicarboxylate transport system permease small subunit
MATAGSFILLIIATYFIATADKNGMLTLSIPGLFILLLLAFILGGASFAFFLSERRAEKLREKKLADPES